MLETVLTCSPRHVMVCNSDRLHALSAPFSYMCRISVMFMIAWRFEEFISVFVRMSTFCIQARGLVFSTVCLLCFVIFQESAVVRLSHRSQIRSESFVRLSHRSQIRLESFVRLSQRKVSACDCSNNMYEFNGSVRFPDSLSVIRMNSNWLLRSVRNWRLFCRQ